MRQVGAELSAEGKRFDPDGRDRGDDRGALRRAHRRGTGPGSGLLQPRYGTTSCNTRSPPIGRTRAFASAYQPLHPAVLSLASGRRSKARAAPAGNSPSAGRWPATRDYTELLLGLGLRAVSVAPGEMLDVRSSIRKVNLETARGIWPRRRRHSEPSPRSEALPRGASLHAGRRDLSDAELGRREEGPLGPGRPRSRRGRGVDPWDPGAAKGSIGAAARDVDGSGRRDKSAAEHRASPSSSTPAPLVRSRHGSLVHAGEPPEPPNSR